MNNFEMNNMLLSKVKVLIIYVRNKINKSIDDLSLSSLSLSLIFYVGYGDGIDLI